MIVCSKVSTRHDSAKAENGQLLDERVPSMWGSQVPGEDVLDKGINVVYHECASVREESYNARLLRVFHFLQHAVE
jgi:hypothetical protein